jgi:hypothetical protein
MSGTWKAGYKKAKKLKMQIINTREETIKDNVFLEYNR